MLVVSVVKKTLWVTCVYIEKTDNWAANMEGSLRGLEVYDMWAPLLFPPVDQPVSGFDSCV